MLFAQDANTARSSLLLELKEEDQKERERAKLLKKNRDNFLIEIIKDYSADVGAEQQIAYEFIARDEMKSMINFAKDDDFT